MIAVIMVATSVMISLACSEKLAKAAVSRREQEISRNLTISVGKLLDKTIVTVQFDPTSMLGRTCAEVRGRLRTTQTDAPYTRAIVLVKNSRLYCSSGLGKVDAPISAYFVSVHTGLNLSVLPGIPFEQGMPIISVFSTTDGTNGVLRIIAGTYIHGLLEAAASPDARQSELTIAPYGSLARNGRYLPYSGVAEPDAVTEWSAVWPFQIRTEASLEFIAATKLRYQIVGALAAILFSALIAAIYLLVFAPRRILLAAVRRGLRHEEFHLAYQPIVDISTKTVTGAEVLLRWNHPRWGAVSPASFLGTAESSPVIRDITTFVLQRSLSDLRACKPAGLWRISINVTPRDIDSDVFLTQILSLRRGLPHRITLVLEIVERSSLHETESTRRNLGRIKAAGIKLALDDFGTKHSNIDVLNKIPFDFVKIDRQYVSKIECGANLVKGILSIAKHFNLMAVAEGVETEAQHEALLSAGVAFGQGFYYGRPVPPEVLFKPPSRQSH